MSQPTKKPARNAHSGDWAKSFRKSGLDLVDALVDRGLLEQGEVSRLHKTLEEGTAGKCLSAAFCKLASFQRRLAGCLAGAGSLSESLRGKRLEALFEINRLIGSIEEPAECFDRLLAYVRKLIACEGATLYLVDRKTAQLTVAASAGPQVDLIEKIAFDGGVGFSGWVARTQRPVLFGSLKRSQPAHAGLVKSFMAVPLVVSGQTIGVITLGHSREDVFTKEDLRLLAVIASQAGGVIQKSLLIEEIRELAITDDLTGLYNRRHLLLRMQEETARATRFLQDFSVVFVDLDEFKHYNDAYGHETGDRALAELAAVLRSQARSTDIVARYGGEEFVLLLPATGRDEALGVAERLRRAVEAHTFPRRKKLTISVGVATFPEDSSLPQELLALADKALYQAKRDGRNRTVVLPAAAA